MRAEPRQEQFNAPTIMYEFASLMLFNVCDSMHCQLVEMQTRWRIVSIYEYVIRFVMLFHSALMLYLCHRVFKFM